MRQLLQCMVLALLALGFMPTGTVAQNFELPTAASASQSKWTGMLAGSHKATGEDAEEQCLRNVNAGLIGLTASDCARLRVMVDGDEGQVVGVPDGIVLNINNGRRNGVSYTTQLVEKQLGRIDRAELFDMGTDRFGNRYFAYFFRGEDTSCNNIAWVILPPEPVEPVEVVIKEQSPLPPKIVCRLVRVDSQPTQQTQMQFLPGFLLQSCCPTCAGPTFIPPMLMQSSNNSGDAVTYMQVCD